MLYIANVILNKRYGINPIKRLPDNAAIGINNNEIPTDTNNSNKEEPFLMYFSAILLLIIEPKIPPIASATRSLL